MAHLQRHFHGCVGSLRSDPYVIRYVGTPYSRKQNIAKKKKIVIERTLLEHLEKHFCFCCRQKDEYSRQTLLQERQT